MPFVWLLQHILARSAENAGVADVFVAHAVRIGFYSTFCTRSAENTGVADVGAVCSGFYSTSWTLT